jgi:aspartate 1-decarboxylase
VRKLLRGKLHHVTVTEADLNYEGSISLPQELMEAAGIVKNEAVQVWNVTRGTRFETYAIPGQRESGCISVNGAAAHLVERGDRLIVACFEYIASPAELAQHEPRVVFIKDNHIKYLRQEVAGPASSPELSDSNL